MQDLETQFVETLLLSLSTNDPDVEITVEHIKPYWLVLEQLVSQEKVLSLGMSDLDKKNLEELYAWAKVLYFKYLLFFSLMKLVSLYSCSIYMLFSSNN